MAGESEGKKELETKEVDIHGVKVILPVDQAERLIAGRDADKASKRELSEKYGKLEAEKNAADAAKSKAEEDKRVLEMAKDGQIEKIRETITKESREREARLAAKARDKHLAALVSSNKRIIDTATNDIVDALKRSSKYDFDSEAVIMLDADGAPAKDADGKVIEAESYLDKWLENRPHYLRDVTQKGTGSTGSVKSSGKSITAEQLEIMTPLDRAKFFADGGKIL